MPDIADLLSSIEGGGEWEMLVKSVRKGRTPQTVLAILPEELAPQFVGLYAKVVLCGSGSGIDGCDSCGGWSEGEHPDLAVVGRLKAAAIDECRALASSLYLKPFIAARKLGVIMQADKLLLPAANSLLKLTEEPPQSGVVLLTAEREDRVLPTIRSRSWVVRFGGLAAALPEAADIPRTPEEWADWIGRTKKFTLDEIALEIDSWIVGLGETGGWNEAVSLQTLIGIALRRYLPVSMVQDASYAILRKGVRCEEIFGDLREAQIFRDNPVR